MPHLDLATVTRSGNFLFGYSGKNAASFSVKNAEATLWRMTPMQQYKTASSNEVA